MTQPGITTVNSSPSGASSKYVHLCGNSISTYDDNSISEIKPLKVDRQALGMLLDSGVILSPRSPYQDFFVLNTGDSLSFDASTNLVTTSEQFHYPRVLSSKRKYNEKDFESLLLEAVESSVDKNSQILLFLSGGKDSATIALALAKTGLKDRVTCITYRSKSQDESELAGAITYKLGLKHEIIDVNNYQVSYEQIKNFFKIQLIPSLDLCATVYMHCGLEQHNNATIMDGAGNDIFVGYVPPSSEYLAARLQNMVPYGLKRAIGSFRDLNRLFMFGSKTRCEMAGFWTFLSSSPIIDEISTYNSRRKHWEIIDHINAQLDYLDLRASLRGRYIDQEKFIRKIKNSAAAYGLQWSLPWTNTRLANYCHNLSESELFDRAKLVNKIFIRKYLRDHLDIDFFAEKKNSFAYNFSEFVDANIDLIRDITLSNDLIEAKLTERHLTKALKTGNYGFVYQLFLLLAWYKFSVYIER